MKNQYAPPQSLAGSPVLQITKGKRGIFLSITLVLQLLIVACMTLAGALLPRLGVPLPARAQIAMIATGIVGLVVVGGVWFWKRWAVYLYFLVAGSGMFLNFIFGQAPALTLATLILHAFIFFAIATRWQHFS